MLNILLLSICLLSPLQEKKLSSPDGKFSISIDTIELSDLQAQYVIQLIDNHSKKSIELANYTIRDLPPPNFYWDKDSQFLIFEVCNNSFEKAKIKVFNLKTKRTDVELFGLIGNNDREAQQYDSDNEIIFYFKSLDFSSAEIPQLCSYELKSKKNKVLMNFHTRFEMDFPTIKRSEEKRELIVNYSDAVSGAHTKLIIY